MFTIEKEIRPHMSFIRIIPDANPDIIIGSVEFYDEVELNAFTRIFELGLIEFKKSGGTSNLPTNTGFSKANGPEVSKSIIEG